MEIGDLEPAEVKPGDVVRIPPGVRQRIKNNGMEDLVSYAPVRLLLEKEVTKPKHIKTEYFNLPNLRLRSTNTIIIEGTN